MGRIVMACYRPHEGKEAELKEVVSDHVMTLKRLGLLTSRVPMVLVSREGLMIELFEWASAEAIEQAHRDPAVMAIWERFGQICEYVPIGEAEEAKETFPEFSPL